MHKDIVENWKSVQQCVDMMQTQLPSSLKEDSMVHIYCVYKIVIVSESSLSPHKFIVLSFYILLSKCVYLTVLVCVIYHSL